MTANRCAGGLKKNKDLRSGSQRHRHFVGFFKITCPSKHRYGPSFLYGYSEKSSHLVAFYDKLGIRRTHFRLKPLGSSRGKRSKETGGKLNGRENYGKFALAKHGLLREGRRETRGWEGKSLPYPALYKHLVKV